MRTTDNSMSRLCNRLMSCAQQSLDQLQYIIDDMEYTLAQNPEREDIKACIEDVKSKIKANESVNWTTANHWGEHFDSISADSTDGPGDVGDIVPETSAEEDDD